MKKPYYSFVIVLVVLLALFTLSQLSTAQNRSEANAESEEQFDSRENQTKIKLNVEELSLTKWDSLEGISYRQLPGANLGAISFEVMDDNRIAFLGNSTSEVIIVNKTSGKAIKRFDVSFAPRDFSYSDGYFFVLTESQVVQYDESGNAVNTFSFPASYAGAERLARLDNATYLLLASGNSLMIESNGRSIESNEREGWVTGAGHFVETRLNGNNSYSVRITTGDGKSYEKSFATDKKVAGVYVVGSTNERIVLDVQTFISEGPISVERDLIVIELSSNGIGPIVGNTKVPDCYYVLSNKDFSLTEDGTIFNMVTAPHGVFVFSLTEPISGTVQDYPRAIVQTKYHFNDHLIQVDNDGNNETSVSAPESTLITRTQIINNAMPYTTLIWTATSANIQSACATISGQYYKTPTWVTVGSNISVPYKWDGFTDVNAFANLAAQGRKAGSYATPDSDSPCLQPTYENASDTQIIGVDCSGFVSRAWGLSTKYGTSTLPSISTQINYSQLQAGDIVNKQGHTRLIKQYFPLNNSAEVIEASSRDWRTSTHTYTPIQESGYLARVYNNVSGGGTPPGPFTLTLTPECNGTTSQIKLNWTPSTGATTYDVYRNGSLYPAGADLPGTQFINSGNITVGNTYSYFVQAKNTAGSTNSNTQSATAPNCTPTSPSVRFSSSNYSVNENDGSVTITATRTGGTGAFNVNYATSNGTAIAGSDYTARSGTLSFGSSDTSKTFSVPIIDDTTVESNETVNLALSSPTGGATLGSPSTAVLTIIDNDSGCPTPSSISTGQTLNGSLASSDCVLSGTNRYFDVYSFSGVAGQGIAASMDSSGFDTYLYLTNSANQILDEDDNSGPGTNSRIPGSSGFFTLPATGSYFLWASSDSDNATGAYSVGLSQCTFSISSPGNEVGPGYGGGTFHMDAPSGCSWSAVSDSTSWLTTSSSGSGDGTVSYDFIVNPNTSPRTGRITVGGQVYTITQIGLGGAGSVRFSSATYNANEGGGDATITVTRTGGTGTGTVNYSTSDGTTTAGVDYTPASGSLIFTGSVTSRTFTVTILDDTAFEGNESINLSLSNLSSSLTLGNPSTASLTIIDNDISPDSTGPNLSINSHSNGQTVSNSTITLYGTASDSGRGDNGISSVTVNGISASGGTASGSGTADWSRSLILNQGTNNITVVARDNSSSQNSTTQSITLNYQPSQNYTIAVSASPSAGGTVSGGGTFAAGSSRTVTATANANYTFTNWTENDSVVSSSASYPFTLNGNRTLVANFSIVSSSNAVYDSTLTAPKCGLPGSACDSGTLLDGRGNITERPEPNQPNTIYGSCLDGTSGTYHNDESIDKIRVSTLDGSNFAPGKTVKIEVTVWVWSSDGSDHLDLYYAVDATNPSFSYIATLEPSHTAGAQALSTTFTLPSGGSLQAVRANFRFEGDVSACSTGNYDDHDDLVFAAVVTGVAPGVTTTPATFVTGTAATLNGSVDPNGSATKGWLEWGTSPTLATHDNTPLLSVGSGREAVPISTGVGGFNPGTTYYFRAAGSNSSGTRRGDILSFRTTALPSLRVNSISVTEKNTGSNATAAFTVSMYPASSQTVTVKFATANGSAAAAADYTARALTTLTFLPGQTSKTVNVVVIGDALDETNETFRLLLSSPTNATIAVGHGVCTILDNDPPPDITIANATVAEPDTGVAYMTFTVRLSAPSARPVSIKYATANGSAAAGPDYTAVPLTTLTFQPGQTVRTFRVAIIGDTGRESNETFFINLSGAVNATITDAQGLGTILNDD